MTRTGTAFRFDSARLQELGGSLAERYRNAHPFPHAVIDDLLPEGVLDAVVDEFPGTDHETWWRFDSDRERKLGSTDESLMGETTAALFAQLNGRAFIDFLQELTGIRGLVPDPHLYGGGLHQIEAGGHLAVHADFNLHPATRLERRLNVLVYLNRGWQESWGGALELWERDMTRCARSIPPLFNRCVIFSTSDVSYHGHPSPLECPAGTTRRSLALYYYSLPAMSGDAEEHNTIFPGHLADLPPDAEPATGVPRRLATRLLPPGARRSLRRMRGRLAYGEARHGA